MNLATLIDKELSKKITITENGQRKTISKREAIAKQIINKAVAGDPKAIQVFMNVSRDLGELTIPIAERGPIQVRLNLFDRPLIPPEQRGPVSLEKPASTEDTGESQGDS